MKVLPDSPADGAWNPDVMLESGPASLNCFGNNVSYHRTAFDCQPSVVGELKPARGVSNYKSAEAFITDENIGSKTEDEIWNIELTCRLNCICQIIGGRGIVKEIRRTTNAERGV